MNQLGLWRDGITDLDDGIVNWGEHTEAEETNHALMAISSSNEVTLCSKTCIDSYNTLKTLCDEQMNQLGDQEAQILAYSQAVKKLEAQLVTFQKQQLSLNEKLTFQANEIYEKDEKLKRYRRIGMKAVKEKEQLQKTVDSWKDSSKNLWRLIDSGMSSNSKVGLGFEIQSNNEVLSFEEEMNFSVFKCSKEDSIGKPSYSRFTKTNDFKGVPHPLSGDYTPKPQEEIDDSLYDICGNTSEHSFETESESLSEPNEMSKSRLEVTNEKDVSAPKSKEVEPSCVSHIKTPRQPLKDKETHKVNRKNWNDMMERELGEGYSFTKKKCFVCGSLNHLIKDCDYYEKKMAREAEVKRVVNTGNRVAKPVWTNANRVNHANQFVPRSVQLNAGRPKLNSVRPNINTGRTNINSVRPKVNAVSPKVNTVRSKQPVTHKTSNSMSPKRPQMNQINQRRDFSKSYSSVRRPFAKSSAQMANSNAAMEVRFIFDSGMLERHMTGNKINWRNLKEFNGDLLPFGELGHFNLYLNIPNCDKQSQQTATANTKADGSLEINATIDTIGYTITEASIRESLNLDDATGITMLPNNELFKGIGQMGGFRGAPRPLLPAMLLVATNPNAGQEHDVVAPSQPSSSTPPVPSTSSPPVITTPTPIPATIPSPTPIPETEPEPFEHIFEEPSPVHQPSSPPQEQAQGQMAMDDLLQVVPKLISRIDSLETDLKQTKLTMMNAIVKLVKKVKKLEGLLKKRHVVLSDSEEEEPEAQRREKSHDDPLALRTRMLLYLQQNLLTKEGDTREEKRLRERSTALKQVSTVMLKSYFSGDKGPREGKAPKIKRREAKQIHLDQLLAQRIGQKQKIKMINKRKEKLKLVRDLQTKTPKRLKDDEAKDDESTKKSGKRRKHMARRGLHPNVDKDDSEDSDEVGSNSSELGIHDHNNEQSSSKLVPKVVPQADKTATSRQELELLFHHHITMLRIHKDGDGDALFQLKSDSLPHANAQTTKT
ncbi:hypothetical protein Tco_0773940 [Tanacetum coccineum]|uniref:CCHC-type domain-containing protein n=1 Tax=Tanacetum coccineum TaxID=301880 RepID=A0ABQ4ZM87_9ASTR